ncbi:MAG TPA: ABC transporter substrate-binding protein, partial [Alphaproteobacteria bacterium]|nr:ABC transporter substrate-binding protein [Alphaproteobacteria bacterium]
TFQVSDTRPQGERDVLVDSRILRPNGPSVGVAWRVRDRDGRFQIIDVSIEGVSMAVTQRNEFASVIQRNGGSVDALLAALRSRISEAKQS